MRPRPLGSERSSMGERRGWRSGAGGALGRREVEGRGEIVAEGGIGGKNGGCGREWLYGGNVT